MALNLNGAVQFLPDKVCEVGRALMETGQPDTFVSQATTRNQKVSIRMRIKYNLFILFGLQSKGTHWFVFAGSHWQKLWQELVFPLLKRNVATSHAAIKQWDKSLNVHQQRVLYTRSTQSNNREVNQKRNTFLKKATFPLWWWFTDRPLTQAGQLIPYINIQSNKSMKRTNRIIRHPYERWAVIHP